MSKTLKIKENSVYLWATIMIWAIVIILLLTTFQGAWLALVFETQVTVLGILIAVGLFTLNKVKLGKR